MRRRTIVAAVTGELVDEHVTLSGDGAANSGAKALTVIGSALVGGDCIDDVDVLRAGATPQLFDQVRNLQRLRAAPVASRIKRRRSVRVQPLSEGSQGRTLTSALRANDRAGRQAEHCR